MSVPLTEGEWIETAIGDGNASRSTQGTSQSHSGTVLVDVYLNQIENNIVTGGVTVRYPVENCSACWAAPSVCQRGGLNFSEIRAYYAKCL